MTINDFISDWHSSSPYIVAHTSGSTGEPKEIRLLKSDMEVSARATNRYFGISASSVLALPLSPDYIAGKMMIVRALLAGCRLLQLPVSKTIALSEHVDFISVVPMQVPSLLDNDPSLIGNVLIGGAPLPDTMRADLLRKGLRAFIGYGMTETCSHIALQPITESTPNGVYHAMPSVTFDTDDRGCLVINAPHYSWRRLVTNDVVELVNPTSFRWLGRYDNVINTGGIKLLPEQIEQYIRSIYPDIPPFFITSQPDHLLGQAVILVLQSDPHISADAVAARLAALTFPKGYRPKRILTIPQIRFTTSGKPLRQL